MIKGFLRNVSVLLILLISVLSFTLCSAAESNSLQLECPQTAKVGTEIEVTLKAEADGILGVSGVFNYDSVNTVFKSIDIDRSNWSVDTDSIEGQINFAASDEFAKNSAKKGEVILTATFTVEGYGQGGINEFSATELKISDDKKLMSAADVKCQVKSPAAAANSGSSANGNSEETVEYIITEGTEWKLEDKDNNYLKSLVVEDVEYTPEFDPAVKKYEAVVPFKIEKVNVIAVPQVETSTVTIENTELNFIGRNIVRITVLSESGLKRTYRVYIQRKAPANKTVGADFEWSLWLIIAIIAGVVLILAAVIITIILIVRKKRKQIS